MSIFKTSKLWPIVFILFSAITSAQKHIDATIIKNTNDTIHSKIRINTTIFDKYTIDERSFYRKIFLVDENGKKKGELKEVKRLTFTDLLYEKRTYINDGSVLKELVYEGKKISWHRRISPNTNGGYSVHVIYYDYLIDKDGKKYKMGMFNNLRKNLIEATESKPELKSEIENLTMTNENILLILKKFDED